MVVVEHLYGRSNFKRCHICINVKLFDTVVAKFSAPLDVDVQVESPAVEVNLANFKFLLSFSWKQTIKFF